MSSPPVSRRLVFVMYSGIFFLLIKNLHIRPSVFQEFSLRYVLVWSSVDVLLEQARRKRSFFPSFLHFWPAAHGPPFPGFEILEKLFYLFRGHYIHTYILLNYILAIMGEKTSCPANPRWWPLTIKSGGRLLLDSEVLLADSSIFFSARGRDFRAASDLTLQGQAIGSQARMICASHDTPISRCRIFHRNSAIPGSELRLDCQNEFNSLGSHLGGTNHNCCRLMLILIEQDKEEWLGNDSFW